MLESEDEVGKDLHLSSMLFIQKAEGALISPDKCYSRASGQETEEFLVRAEVHR